MRANLALVAALTLVAAAGCLGGGEEPVQSVPPADWLVAQADATGGDVAGFVYTVPELPPCDVGVDAEASAEASEEGASASAGGASAEASPDGVSARAPCAGASAEASADGASASASAGGASASAGLDGVTVEVVPDTSGLDGLHEYVLMAYTVSGGTATHVQTVLSTEVERIQQEAGGAVDTAVQEAQALPFLVPLEGLGLEPGDQLAFVMAASASAEAEVTGVMRQAEAGARSALSSTGVPVDAPDFGFAFRLVDAAQADPEAALAELQALAGGAEGEAMAAVAEAEEEAQEVAGQAQSLLDQVVATGKAKVLSVVGQAQGFDIGFFAEFANGSLEGIDYVRFVTDTLSIAYEAEGLLKPILSTETLTLSYDGVAAEGFGFGLGAYGGQENGQVDYDVSATVHDQSYALSGSVTAAGGTDLGDLDPAYVLAGAGGEAQRLVFDVARKAQDEATRLFALHTDLSASLEDLLGVTDVAPVDLSDVEAVIPVSPTTPGLEFETRGLGTVHVVGLW